MSVIFMFSGQGSQHYQMGRSLFAGDAIFRASMLHLDRVARCVNGNSILEVLYFQEHGRSDRFDRTLWTHPAIFMAECSLAQALQHRGVMPDIVLGVSMGAFAAAAVAGCMEVEGALEATIRQATLLEENCERGGMIAVLSDPSLYEEPLLNEGSELAAVNSTSHFVIAARQDRCAAVERHLQQNKVGYQRLPVSFAFHSRWIDRACEPFAAHMRSVRSRRSSIEVMGCHEAARMRELPADYLWDSVRRPIRFREAIAALECRGPHCYIDAGSAGTLATLLKYMLPQGSSSKVYTIMSPFDRDLQNLAALAHEQSHSS